MKGNATVIANLQKAAALEAHLAAQLHLDWRLAKDRGLSAIASQVHEFAEKAECHLKSITDRLLDFDVMPAYECGAVAANEPARALFQFVADLLTAMVAPEVGQYQEFAAQAWAALDDKTRNQYEHWIKWHEADLAWLEGELAEIADMGEKNYIMAQRSK